MKKYQRQIISTEQNYLQPTLRKVQLSEREKKQPKDPDDTPLHPHTSASSLQFYSFITFAVILKIRADK